MRKALSLVLLLFTLYLKASAQLADGSTAPDFTFNDINGNPHTLYSYLNQGKYVAIDISATWCNPCWTYHNEKVMDSLYEAHDIPGDNSWKVLFMEMDKNTTTADLYGTGSNTQGNWVQGANYTIIDAPAGTALNDFNNGYSLSFFPTFLLICPNKKVFQDSLNGPRPGVKTWEYIASISCFPAGIDNLSDRDPVTIYPNPASAFTTIYFGLNNPASISVTVSDITGKKLSSKSFGLLSSGDHSLNYAIGHLSPGLYVLSLHCGNNRTISKKIVVR